MGRLWQTFACETVVIDIYSKLNIPDEIDVGNHTERAHCCKNRVEWASENEQLVVV